MKNLLIAAMCVAALSLGFGCQQQQQRSASLDGSLRSNDVHEPITVDSVVRDMSPELTTRAETRDEGRVRTAHVLDINTRTIWDDLRTILLLDRPSRLSMFPTP